MGARRTRHARPQGRAARGSVRLRSRRQAAALLTRPARGALLMASGRRASARFARFDHASGGSNKGLAEESKKEKKEKKQKALDKESPIQGWVERLSQRCVAAPGPERNPSSHPMYDGFRATKSDFRSISTLDRSYAMCDHQSPKGVQIKGERAGRSGRDGRGAVGPIAYLVVGPKSFGSSWAGEGAGGAGWA